MNTKFKAKNIVLNMCQNYKDKNPCKTLFLNGGTPKNFQTFQLSKFEVTAKSKSQKVRCAIPSPPPFPLEG